MKSFLKIVGQELADADYMIETAEAEARFLLGIHSPDLIAQIEHVGCFGALLAEEMSDAGFVVDKDAAAEVGRDRRRRGGVHIGREPALKIEMPERDIHRPPIAPAGTWVVDTDDLTSAVGIGARIATDDHAHLTTGSGVLLGQPVDAGDVRAARAG